MKPPNNCLELNPNCPNLNPHHREGRMDLLYTCIVTNTVLEVEYSHLRRNHTEQSIVRIIPHWECPYLKEGRNKGIYPSYQARINEKGLLTPDSV